MISLLDVNVLLALAWPNHVHHASAHRWFGPRRQQGWATCPLTQCGFLRLSAHPGVVGVSLTVADAFQNLERNLRAPDHHFWSMSRSWPEVIPEIRGRVAGHRQVNDALLLDLALANGGKLATFDRRLEVLLSGLPGLAGRLEVIEI